MTPEANDALLPIGDASAEYGIPARVIREAGQRGELELVRDGRVTLCRRWEVAALAARYTASTTMA